MKMVLYSFAASLLVLIGIGNAALINGGFESGDLTGWQVLGDASVQTSSFGSGPTQGTRQAVLTNDWVSFNLGVQPTGYVYPLSGSPAVLHIDDSFLGLSTGSLKGITNAPYPGERYAPAFGSALQQKFYGVAGTKLSFDWNYFTNDGFNYDYCFVSLALSDFFVVEKLAGNDPSAVPGGTNWPPPLVTSNTVFEKETGFRTFSFILPETGIYTLGIGVTGVTDETLDSGIIVDNFQVLSVSEASTMLFFGVGLVGLAGLMVLQRKNQLVSRVECLWHFGD